MNKGPYTHHCTHCGTMFRLLNEQEVSQAAAVICDDRDNGGNHELRPLSLAPPTRPTFGDMHDIQKSKGKGKR